MQGGIESESVRRLLMQRMQQGYVYSRRALLLAPAYGHGESSGGASQGMLAAAGQEAPAADGGAGPAGTSSFDANVVMILAVLLCALICALGLNSIVRCALRCSTGSSRAMAPPPPPPPPAAAQQLQAAGVRRKALRAMPTMVYSAGLRLQASPACAICLADLEPGERVRVLPKCNHGFHVRCVDRWLLARSTCPTCRQPLFAAPGKAAGCDDGGAAAPAARPFLVPLRAEGFVTPYDF
ncbi:RING-H2 finger protein ATL74-like [Oryza brachyantha]|uniref:RING-H2 finger protein ATL74-like n=1 Tax=Oryza brachyantha TaxID=4533 RepID=UPI001ADCD50A|nr:RING-H2 finger protein ATL74-like [Oryza brachyantha]